MANSQPKGIEFFNTKSGETHFCQLEPTIAAYINSSDMGINASRGQDFAWRLAPSWVKKVKKFRADDNKMEHLTNKNGGEAPTVVQILYTIYGEQLRVAEARAAENENVFEEAYLQAISNNDDSVDIEKNKETVKPSSK
jgi:hypothetical protein